MKKSIQLHVLVFCFGLRTGFFWVEWRVIIPWIALTPRVLPHWRSQCAMMYLLFCLLCSCKCVASDYTFLCCFLRYFWRRWRDLWPCWLCWLLRVLCTLFPKRQSCPIQCCYLSLELPWYLWRAYRFSRFLIRCIWLLICCSIFSYPSWFLNLVIP